MKKLLKQFPEKTKIITFRIKKGFGNNPLFFIFNLSILIKMIRHFLVVVLLLQVIFLRSQHSYDFNDECKEAYAHIISLRFDKGKKIIASEKVKDPENNIPYLLDNYIYFLTLFIGEEESVFKELEPKKGFIIDRLKDGDEESPYYRYCLAQVYLQWAVARTKFGEYVSATFEINKAYRLLEKNKTEFPDFIPHNINLGLLHTMIGTIPDNYNWVKKIVGIEGTIDQGLDEILKVLNVALNDSSYSHYKAECLFYLSFIQINLMTDQQKTFEYLDIIESDTENLENPLAVYSLSRIYMSNAMNDKAIDLLTHRPKGKEYFDFYYLDYLAGIAKLHRLDKDADDYFLKYLKHFKGNNYIKDAYQKIGWHYFVHGYTRKYKDYMQKVLDYGNTDVDADKQAEREAKKGELPNYNLLRARLLFDGGYYPEALTEITVGKINHLRNGRDSLEYFYRIGRIYHEWGKIDVSISYYEKTIQHGANSEYYFAANSALKLGNIYEDKGDLKKAEYFYERAQSMENKEYRNSINQKAKAGINRVETKNSGA